MTDTSRRRAQITGLHVVFESRNPKLASVRWHPRFKQRYRSKADAEAAKQAWEERGRILFPGDFGKEKPAPKPLVRSRIRETGFQQELRI
jgi:hypothetical protein